MENSPKEDYSKEIDEFLDLLADIIFKQFKKTLDKKRKKQK